MAQCTDIERRLLDKLAAGERDLNLEAEYNVATCLAKAPEFFEKAVRARMALIAGSEAWEAINQQWGPLGFSGGKVGGVALAYDRIEQEAKRRLGK